MDLSKFIIADDISIIDALKTIDENGYGVVFSVFNGKLQGVVTDGDIRRYILMGKSLEAEIKEVINYHPKTLLINSNQNIEEYMRKYRILALPILNDEGEIIRIELRNKEKVYQSDNLNVPVIIMAGGQGKRLAPYTQILPKPLISIGDRTITEHILERFSRNGCNDFYMIVNYKKNFIKAFFLDDNISYDVQFLEEKIFQGTGGGLKLLEGIISETFFLTNCDILIDEDYSLIYDFHKKHKNIITMVCASKMTEIPYGIVEVSESGRVMSLKEKPQMTYLTNTGLYVIEPEFLEKINNNETVDITDVIQRCIDAGDQVGMFPISELSWMDMGQLDELERMKMKLKIK